MINWESELPLIKLAASKHGIDWCFVASIRQVENGNPGREFGVLDGTSTTYAEQLATTCASVAHRLEVYPSNPLVRAYGANGQSRIRYTPGFLSYFSSIWAPVGASNDPTHLNQYWLDNVSLAYHSHVLSELI